MTNAGTNDWLDFVVDSQTSRLLGQMTRILMHDLQQPLSSLINYANGAARRIDSLRIETPEVAPLLRKISELGFEISARMRIPRKLAREEPPQRQPIDVGALMESIAKLGSLLTRDAWSRLEVHTDDEDATTFGDETMMLEAILTAIGEFLEHENKNLAHMPRVIVRAHPAMADYVAIQIEHDVHAFDVAAPQKTPTDGGDQAAIPERTAELLPMTLPPTTPDNGHGTDHLVASCWLQEEGIPQAVREELFRRAGIRFESWGTNGAAVLRLELPVPPVSSGLASIILT